MDGFPRTSAQATYLADILSELGTPLDVVVELRVDERELVRRLTGRRTCRDCGRSCHLVFTPPAKADTCDACGGALYQRDDDTADAIHQRLRIYEEQNARLTAFYRDSGILASIDATGSVESVQQRLMSVL